MHTKLNLEVDGVGVAAVARRVASLGRRAAAAALRREASGRAEAVASGQAAAEEGRAM
jgi:hypothetical protein